MMRIVSPAALVSAALVLGGFAATFPILAADPPPPGCTGDRWHYSHTNPTGCTYEHNPHFGQLAANVSCESSASGHKGCDGCNACCNGRLDAKTECICENMGWGKASCFQAAISANNTCRGNCVGLYHGNGCTDPEFRLD